MSPTQDTPRYLVACEGGLPLDSIKADEGFQLQVDSNPKGSNEAGLCRVRIIDSISRETEVDITVEFTFIHQTVIYDDVFYLERGVYFVDALYYDKHTNLSYDKYFFLFTVRDA